MIKEKKIKQVVVIAVLLALVGGGIFSLLNIKNYFINKETKELAELNIIYNNIFIRGNAVGGLNREQAVSKMNRLINEDYSGDKKLNFKLASSGYERSFTYPELGMGFDVEKAVSEAYAIGRREDGSSVRNAVAELDMGGKYIDAEYSYSNEKIKQCLSVMESEVNKELESEGKVMDLDRTAEAAEQMLMVNEYDALIIIATK